MKKYLLLILLSEILFFANAFAQDRQFAFAYQSNVLSKNSTDLEATGTFHTGRKYFYNGLENRIEFETGLTDRIQTSFYLNASQKAYAPNKDTLGGIADATKSGITSESEISVSNEWKINLLNPSVKPIGLALYAELTASPKYYEIENKLILDNRTEKNILAFNLTNEYEVGYYSENGRTKQKQEDEVELNFGCMHLFKPNFGAGLEMRNSNEIESGSWNFSALFGGPALFYSGEKHFLILTILPQWTNLRKTEDAPNNLVLNAHEKLEVRMLWGFSL